MVMYWRSYLTAVVPVISVIVLFVLMLSLLLHLLLMMNLWMIMIPQWLLLLLRIFLPPLFFRLAH